MVKGKRELVWFSFVTEKEMHDYAKKQGNFSGYIKSLIRRDMEFQTTGVDTETLNYIIEVIESKFSGRLIDGSNQQPTKIEVIDLVNDLF